MKRKELQKLKREEAAKRQSAYDALSTELKLARIAKRRGESKKERARLEAALAKEKK